MEKNLVDLAELEIYNIIRALEIYPSPLNFFPKFYLQEDSNTLPMVPNSLRYILKLTETVYIYILHYLAFQEQIERFHLVCSLNLTKETTLSHEILLYQLRN